MNQHDQPPGDYNQPEKQDPPQPASDPYAAGIPAAHPQPQQPQHSYQYNQQGNYQGQPPQPQPQPQAYPQQQGGGEYRPAQPPQYGGGDYYPNQPPPQQPYYTGGQPPGPPKKRGMPLWAWLVPLLIILLVAAGFGAWTYMAAQERAASDARATTTAVAQANAASTSQAQGTSTAVVRGKTSTAVVAVTSTAQAEADITATAVEQAFATMMAGGAETPTTMAAIDPTRMPIEEFLKLYNDPANRPIVVDVRSKAAFDEGHIAGAVNIPGSETESRLNELPTDKLIVAYCQ